LKRLAIVLAGARSTAGWQLLTPLMDFYDLKGVVSGLLDGLRLSEVKFETAEHPSYHRQMREGHGRREQIGVMARCTPR